MAWSDEVHGPYDIQFAVVDPMGLSLSHQESLRGKAANAALLPRMVRTNFGFFATWEDTRDANENQIYMALVDPTGASLGGGLVEQPNTGDANWPNVAWSGTDAAIVYYQFRDGRPQIYLTLMDGTGARVKGLRDLQVSNGSNGWSKYPDVAWTGSDFGVMYVDSRDGAPALWFQRVHCQG